MNLFIDTLSCGNQVYGVGQVLREHLRNLPAAMGMGFRPYLIVSEDTRELYRDVAAGFDTVLFPARLRIRQLSLPRQLAWERFSLNAVIRRAGNGVYWRPNLSFCVDVGCPQVTTVHDLAEYDPEGGRQYSRLRLTYRRAALRSVMSRSARILTVSEHAARSLRSRFPHRSGDIRVAPNGGPEPIPMDRTDPICYLTAGRIHRHKNLMTLCRAYIQCDKSAKMDLPLVILGGDGNASGELKAYIAAEGYEDRILFKGYVSETVKWEWYAKAKAFLFPSRFEGFGIPVLEAMAQGVPVICSNAASLPEVSGDAVLPLDPADVGAWDKAFASLRDGSLDLENMSRSGRANVERFSWKTSTEAIAGIFKELSDGFAPTPTHAMNKAGA